MFIVAVILINILSRLQDSEQDLSSCVSLLDSTKNTLSVEYPNARTNQNIHIAHGHVRTHARARTQTHREIERQTEIEIPPYIIDLKHSVPYRDIRVSGKG